jgi:D-alanyl-D-alanine carboxypeptidase
MAQLLDAGFDRMVAEKEGRTTQVADASPANSNDDDAGDVKADASNTQDYQIASGVSGSTAQGDDEDGDVSTAPAKKVVTKKNWSVQIGSYNTRKKSLSAIHQAKRKSVQLRAATPKLLQVKANKGTIYRARLTGLNERDARAACTSLSNAGFSCLPLPPRS